MSINLAKTAQNSSDDRYPPAKRAQQRTRRRVTRSLAFGAGLLILVGCSAGPFADTSTPIGPDETIAALTANLDTFTTNVDGVTFVRPNPAGPRPQRCSAPESSDDRDYFVDQRDLLTEEGSAEAVLAEINSRLSAAGVSGDFEAKQFAYKAKADSAVTNLVLVVGRTPCVDQMPEQKSYATERRNDVSSALHGTVNHVEGIVGHALVL